MNVSKKAGFWIICLLYPQFATASSFIAAKEKYASYTSKIGVHSASDTNGKETGDAAIATLLMLRFTKLLGASDAVVVKMANTPPDQIAILSVDELHQMCVDIYDEPIQPQYLVQQCHPLDLLCQLVADDTPPSPPKRKIWKNCKS